jgi:hypothetical protein
MLKYIIYHIKLHNPNLNAVVVSPTIQVHIVVIIVMFKDRKRPSGMMFILRFRKFGCYYLCNNVCCRNQETDRKRHIYPTNRDVIKELGFGGTLNMLIRI